MANQIKKNQTNISSLNVLKVDKNHEETVESVLIQSSIGYESAAANLASNNGDILSTIRVFGGEISAFSDLDFSINPGNWTPFLATEDYHIATKLLLDNTIDPISDQVEINTGNILTIANELLNLNRKFLATTNTGNVIEGSEQVVSFTVLEDNYEVLTTTLNTISSSQTLTSQSLVIRLYASSTGSQELTIRFYNADLNSQIGSDTVITINDNGYIEYNESVNLIAETNYQIRVFVPTSGGVVTITKGFIELIGSQTGEVVSSSKSSQIVDDSTIEPTLGVNPWKVNLDKELVAFDNLNKDVSLAKYAFNINGTPNIINASGAVTAIFRPTDFDVLNKPVINVSNPINDQDATTKIYVDVTDIALEAQIAIQTEINVIQQEDINTLIDGGTPTKKGFSNLPFVSDTAFISGNNTIEITITNTNLTPYIVADLQIWPDKTVFDSEGVFNKAAWLFIGDTNANQLFEGITPLNPGSIVRFGISTEYLGGGPSTITRSTYLMVEATSTDGVTLDRPFRVINLPASETLILKIGAGNNPIPFNFTYDNTKISNLRLYGDIII